MLFFYLFTAFSRDCNPIEFDIHGRLSLLQTDASGWVFAGSGFGDFGHTINIHSWPRLNHSEECNIYLTYDHTCPNENSTEITGSEIFLSSNSQYAIFGIKCSPNEEVVVSVASTVRPIHPNSAQACIYGLFIFFVINFVLTGLLQFFYFRGAMDPNEYRLNDNY